MKIFLIFAISCTVPLIILSAGMLQNYRAHYIENGTAKLSREAQILATNLFIAEYFENRDDSYLDAVSTLAEGRVVVINNYGVVAYDSNNVDVGNLYVSDEVIRGLKGERQSIYYSDSYTAKVIRPIISYSTGDVFGLVILTKKFYDIQDSYAEILNITVLSIIGITVLFVSISVYTSLLMTKPFEQITHYVNKVRKGLTDEKMQIKGNNEAEQISEAFNKMFEEARAANQNRQQFVENVSHELKTPLSSVKILAEALLSDENAPVELYREFLEDINSEIDRETKIVNDLLALVTLDKKENGLNISKVNVNDLVERIMRRLKPLAEGKNLHMIFESHRQVEAEIDEVKIESAISNLIDNAIKYNRDEGVVKVTLDSNHQDFILYVYDNGYGIPSDSLEKIFKRFYRTDKTRSRATGGTGLGLSIVSETVKNHGGNIKCESDGERYSEFVVTVPLRYNS